MKIKTKTLSYDQVLKEEPYVHHPPRKQSLLFRWLIFGLSYVDLFRVKFRFREIGMEKLNPKQPCLILMNHSSFIDLKIIARIFFRRPYQIVCTLDGFVGKNWLMKMLGCIPTKKFITDTALVRDMVYSVKELKSSIVMYPEASYSFDGTATALPESIGKCLKLLKVPVVMVRSYGAFLRDPLYNGLQIRKMKVSADVEYILSPEDIKEKSAEELKAILDEHFTFDHFRWQQENQIRIPEKFRADHLNRVLYKCPHCQAEGKMSGKGIHLTCMSCGKVYELTEYGFMKAAEGETEIDHIPAWYQWERESVRKELLTDTYVLDVPVDIYIMIKPDCVYRVGEGRLRHTKEGFHLTGCSGRLDYHQVPERSYSLYSDFYWYEIGDVICIGDTDRQYYCFPKETGDIVAKTRLAAEELYKITKEKAARGKVQAG
ncbi:MAG: 1-acyl-sn-glycerol-3-phosphate acyltransferase [Lachnospiraceae bacterium]|nr:1-acyl-sn-glycerol-3-phosphate acyltransferase [Lachnospiraceae bacterium]